MKGPIQTAFVSIGVGFLLSMLQSTLGTSYLSDFLRGNLIALLIALLAINSATLGVILTKIRDLVDKHGNVDCFNNTKREMMLSLKEQVFLIVIGTIFLMLEKAPWISQFPYGVLAINVLLSAVFTYSMIVLYDTAKSVFSVLDFDPRKNG